MDDELRAYLMDMEERMIVDFRRLAEGAVALSYRILALEAAAKELREQIERLLDRVEDPAESRRRR